MTDARIGLTFAQAEGAEALPAQLALREISPELSAVLWAAIYDTLNSALSHDGIYGASYYFSDPWKQILRLWWVLRLHRNADELPKPHDLLQFIKNVMTSKDYIKVFDFLQFVISRPECPTRFPTMIDKILENNRAAYRVIDKHIIPITSNEQAEAVRADILTAKNAAARGPYTHLRAAGEALNSGDWSQAIRESIHAVEASAKSIEPAATTLAPALDRLKVTIGLHPALSKAYSALYGYSSDEEGIRHALVFADAANVTERDAIFMFSACAAFAGYLLSAERKEGSA